MNPRKRGFSDLQSDQSGFETDPYAAPGLPDMNFGGLLNQNLNQVPFQGGQMVPYIGQPPFGMPGTGFGNSYLDGGAAGQQQQQQQQADEFGQDDGYPEDLDKRIQEAKAKKKGKLPPFVEKVATFVNDENNFEIIRWSEDGDSFIVLDEDRFSKELIPGVFKHNNFASFVRQLNMYNFHKKVGMTDGSLKASMDGQKARLEYEHKYFKRGHPDMLFLIEKPKAGRKSKSVSGKKLENVKEESDDDISDDDHYENERSGVSAPRMIEDTPSAPTKQEFYPAPNPAQNGPSHVTNIKPSGLPQPYSTIHPVVDHIVSQIQELKSQQNMISTAITRLRQEHQQLNKQATKFQEMHDRHEMSISNILQFLASVYNKNIDNMNQNGMVPQNTNSVIQAFAKHPAADLVNVRPAKRTRYLIEDGRNTAGNRKPAAPEFETASEDGLLQDRLQELDTPTDKDTPSTLRHASVTPVATPGKLSLPGSTALIRNNPSMLSLSSTPVPQMPSDQELRSLVEHQAAIDQGIKAVQQNVENFVGHHSDELPTFDPGAIEGFNFPDNSGLDNWIAAMSPGALQTFTDNLKDFDPTATDNLFFDQSAIENGVLNTHIDSANGTPEPGGSLEHGNGGQTPEA